ncbi:MAG: TolB family protein [Paracoccaceae bacterium]
MKSVLCVWDITSATETVILTVDRHIEAPNWHPDGSHLLLNGSGRLLRVALNNPRLEPFETGFATRCNNDHGISPDGKTIALSSHTERGSEIYLMPASGGTPTPVTTHAPSWWHGWSPDGQTLTYVGARNGSRVVDVFTIPIVGGNETRLTHGEGHCDGPDFSADGKQIYYNSDRDGHAQIWVMDAGGANQRKLFADDHVNWFPHPSPCGRHLVYLAYPPGTLGHPANLPVALVLCKADGTNRRRILEFTGGQGTINVPSWRADGNAFAFVRYEDV